MNGLFRLTVILYLLFVVFSSISFGDIEKRDQMKIENILYEHWYHRMSQKIADTLQNCYRNKTINECINTLRSVDRYIKFKSELEMQKRNDMKHGKYSGIGVVWVKEPKSGGLLIKRLHNGPLSRKKNVSVGDIVIKIGPSRNTMIAIKPFSRLEISKKLREWSNVFLTIKRAKKPLVVVNVKIGDVEKISADYKIFGSVCYIAVYDFQNELLVPKFVKPALSKCKNSGAHSLILDLQNNHGGQRNIQEMFLDLFSPKKGAFIRRLQYSFGESIDSRRITTKLGQYNDFLKNCIILVNSFTASASEIVARTLHKWNAKTAGVQTYGKGVMIRTFLLPSKSALTLTVAKTIYEDGTSHDGIGITPDIIIEPQENPLEVTLQLLQ